MLMRLVPHPLLSLDTSICLARFGEQIHTG